MNQGFIITASGWEILAKAISGNKKLEISGVAIGSGKLESGEVPALFTKLKSPIADGALSDFFIETEKDESGEVKQATVSFIAEYRTDYGSSQNDTCNITQTFPINIENDFNLNEFGVYAQDPETKENVLIYYATLGDYPHPVTSYSKGAIDIRRYPVSMVLSSDIEVSLVYPPNAFVTHDEMTRYAQNVCKPLFLDLAQLLIDEHDVNPDAHLALRDHIYSNDVRITALEKLLNGTSAASFRYNFETLDDFTMNAGVYNEKKSRIEF